MFWDSFLRSFYEIFYEIRLRTFIPYWVRWIKKIIIMLQMVIFTLDFCNLNDFYGEELSTFRTLNNIFLFSPWLVQDDNALFILSVSLLLHGIFIGIFYIFALKCKQHIFIKKEILTVFRVFIDVIFPLFQYEQFFLFSEVFIKLLEQPSIFLTIALLLMGCEVCIYALYDYMASIFIRPCLFTIESIIERYSGVTDQIFYWCKFSSLFVQVYLSNRYHYLVEIILYCLLLFAIIYVICARVGRGIHVTIIGALMEDAPLIIQPLVLLYHLHRRWPMAPLVV